MGGRVGGGGGCRFFFFINRYGPRQQKVVRGQPTIAIRETPYSGRHWTELVPFDFERNVLV